MCATGAKARHDLIAFCDHVFHDMVPIRVSDKEVTIGLFQAFQVGRKARRRIVVDEVRGDERVEEKNASTKGAGPIATRPLFTPA